MKIKCMVFIFFIFLLFSPQNLFAKTVRMGFFISDSDAYTFLDAAKQIDVPDLDVKIFKAEDINKPEILDFIACMDIAIVDIMQSNPADWLLANKSKINPKAKIYAVRMSSHTKDFINAGFIIDKKVRDYFKFTDINNSKNMILYLAKREFDFNTSFEPPFILPENALYHPLASKIFTNMGEYFDWYKKSGHYREGEKWNLITIFSTFLVETKKQPLDALITALEKNKINTVTLLYSFKTGNEMIETLISSEPLKSGIGSITGFTFKFNSILSENLLNILKKADVPIFNGQYLFFTPKENWLASLQGISPVGLAFQFSTPELSGLVEPTVIGVKEKIEDKKSGTSGYFYVPDTRQTEMLAQRIAKWHSLQKKANKDKNTVLVYYNHGSGKQNIGASYLNVFRSMEKIIKQMKSEGYFIEGELSEDKIMDLIIKSGRNVGTWAPDELKKMMATGDVITIDISQYKKWISEIDKDFLFNVEKDWKRPEDSTIMVKDGKFIIPCIRLGNLTLVPQPVRGLTDDPDKLYHSTILYPHHQYTAFYLWLQKELKPDVMISLGTHGTHEWLPGKQAGMTQSCSPEVLIGDIPSLYPYIADDVGEGIQAKRRGRGVVIDHAVPPFKKGGLYEEYSKIAAIISEYDAAVSEKIKLQKLARIKEMVFELGLEKDLEIEDVNDESIEKIEHYILSLKTELIPYGLHTFGRSATGEALNETAEAIAEKSSNTAQFYKKQLLACGPSEMESLMRGLRGGYIPPASGNDPVRNPESLPTGKNFYAFDPEKVPSKEAYKLGKNAAEELVKKYIKEHDGTYPEQIGIILWSVETIRNEGINTATALYLMGMEPVWDKRDKIKGLRSIPGKELGRPRIDVLLQMSGLFRDLFPTVALFLDKAVKEAALLTDVENFLKNHADALEKSLLNKGYSPDKAKKFSTIRLFSARPGAYGTKLDDMTSASGLWEDDKVLADVFVDMVSFGYSGDMWGDNVKEIYKKNLQKVDATIHSISSNLYSTMDNDDMFQYLGGLSMAVRKESGKDPDVFISQQKTIGQGHIESAATTIGKELRSRYLNPKWITGMKAEKYAGAREMEKFVEYMWGWQVTVPKAIDRAKWEQTYQVYVEDKYDMELKEFFNKENPWAYQSMTARMLESIRKDYWKPEDKIKKKLAVEYAVNVVEKGVACCDHTCNNPALNQMVVNIISLPGVLSPDMVEKFKIAVEQAVGKALDKQVQERTDLLEKLKQGFNQKAKQSNQQINDQKETLKKGKDSAAVEGYKMEEVKTKDESTELTSSGIQWVASLFVIFIIGLAVYGAKRKTGN